MKPILAAIVLYRMSFADSPAYRTLARTLCERPELEALIDILVVDNSAQAQSVPAEFRGTYVHDGANPGLAARYNLGLTLAEQRGASWLMLLDQDTSLTAAYVEEVARLSAEWAADGTAIALAPKLMEHGAVQSPHPPLFVDSPGVVDAGSYGLQAAPIRVYNSGAVLRVRALQAIGGFPEEYWLDYLDHATFHRLQAAGGKIFVMEAQLSHEMSIHQPNKEANPAYAARQANQLAAEVRFYRQYGSLRERRRHRRHLAKQGVKCLLRGAFREAARYFTAVFSRA